ARDSVGVLMKCGHYGTAVTRRGSKGAEVTRVSVPLSCPLRSSAPPRPSACQSSFRNLRPPRAAYTLAELLVALTIGGVMLAIVTNIAVRQQRAFADLADAAALSAQLHDVRA